MSKTRRRRMKRQREKEVVADVPTQPMSEKKPLDIKYPPDFIFKYRKPSRVAPAQEVIPSKQGVFDYVGTKYPSLLHKSEEFFKNTNLKREWFKYPVSFRRNPQTGENEIMIFQDYPPVTPEEEKMGGQLSCFKDCPYPFKGHPFPEALYAVNMSKRILRHELEFYADKDVRPLLVGFLLMGKKRKIRILEKFLVKYGDICQKTMGTYILEREFMSKYGQEILKFVHSFLKKYGVNEEIAYYFAEAFASQIDWDNAYWMRIGDCMFTTSKEEMLENPRRELLKLGQVLISRQPLNDGGGRGPEGERINKMLTAISLLLYLPRYRRIFKECIQESTFENFQFDRADTYHSLVYGDYDYLGLPSKKRMDMYHEYHKEHPPLPPRLEISRG